MRAVAAGILALGLALPGCSGAPQAEARKPQRPHVVLLVLDELPGDTLLGPGGRIDAGRYPSFAALAADSTWFRNAYASYDSTTKAVPLILDRIAPRPRTAPVSRDHPRNLFTVLGRRGWRVRAFEEATSLCPRSLCPGARPRRPAIVPT